MGGGEGTLRALAGPKTEQYAERWRATDLVVPYLWSLLTD
jgi:hypothetical protein